MSKIYLIEYNTPKILFQGVINILKVFFVSVLEGSADTVSHCTGHTPVRSSHTGCLMATQLDRGSGGSPALGEVAPAAALSAFSLSGDGAVVTALLPLGLS